MDHGCCRKCALLLRFKEDIQPESLRYLFTLTGLHSSADDVPLFLPVGHNHVSFGWKQDVVGWLVLDETANRKGKETFAVCRCMCTSKRTCERVMCVVLQMWKPTPGQSSLAKLLLHHRTGENPDACDAPWLTVNWDSKGQPDDTQWTAAEWTPAKSQASAPLVRV